MLKVRKDGSWLVNYGENGSRDGNNITVRRDGEYYVLLALHEGDRHPDLALLPVPFSGVAGTVRELEQRLEAEYPVRIYVDPDQPVAGSDPSERDPAEPMAVCALLLDLEEFLDSLPPGMLTEIHDGTPAVPEPSGTLIVPGGRIRIVIVRGWKDGVGAFTNETTMSVFFCTETHIFTNFPHEFAHLIDGRLRWILFGLGRDPDAEWMALNPVHAYDGSLSSGVAADFFVSEYAGTDTWEDKAETFRALYTSSEPMAEALWYRDHTGIQAKVAYLTETLREVFPSVQAVDRAVWEKR